MQLISINKDSFTLYFLTSMPLFFLPCCNSWDLQYHTEWK